MAVHHYWGLHPHPIPSGLWEKLGADILEFKMHSYLVIVGYYSKYPDLCLLKDKTASTVIQHLKSVFARHSIPDEMITDNMPFGSREIRNFADEGGFVVTTSSPRYPQADGKSERVVQMAKKMPRKADEDGCDSYIALLEYLQSQASHTHQQNRC